MHTLGLDQIRATEKDRRASKRERKLSLKRKRCNYGRI